MSDLAAFLLARIVDDTALARQAQAQAVTDGDDPDDPRRVDTRLARLVLAECAAKRQVIEWADRWRDEPELPLSVDDVLLALAGAYSSHPEFDPSWGHDGKQQ